MLTVVSVQLVLLAFADLRKRHRARRFCLALIVIVTAFGVSLQIDVGRSALAFTCSADVSSASLARRTSRDVRRAQYLNCNPRVKMELDPWLVVYNCGGAAVPASYCGFLAAYPPAGAPVAAALRAPLVSRDSFLACASPSGTV